MTLILAIAAVLVTLIVWELASDWLWKQGVDRLVREGVAESSYQVLKNDRLGARVPLSEND